MMTEEMQKRYEEFVESGLAAKEEAELIAGQPDPEIRTTQEQANLDEQKYQEEWGKHRSRVHENLELDFGKIFDPKNMPRISEETKKMAKTLECILETEEYLGWLKGKTIEAKLNNDFIHTGYYQGLSSKFVMENTP